MLLSVVAMASAGGGEDTNKAQTEQIRLQWIMHNI
jgi:hypothetical protein